MVIESDGTRNNKPLTRMQVAMSKKNTSKGPFPGSNTEDYLAYWECFCTCNLLQKLTTNKAKTENRIASSVIFFVNSDIEWEKVVKGMWLAAALPFDLWSSETDHKKQTVLDLMLCMRKSIIPKTKSWALFGFGYQAHALAASSSPSLIIPNSFDFSIFPFSLLMLQSVGV